MLGITANVKVSGTELKVRIEKALTTKELNYAIKYLSEILSHEGLELPCWMEGVIIERLRNAGVSIKKNGDWYRCIAAYTILPKMEEFIEFERRYTRAPECGAFEDINVEDQWIKLVNETISITFNAIEDELKNEE
ncbi:MAG: hypothetical protein D6735_15170 [Acidobacteria bacterium]|nr:MAG: hypothetical protein D6735_15170 [Acidobacteriota bacterium]